MSTKKKKHTQEQEPYTQLQIDAAVDQTLKHSYVLLISDEPFSKRAYMVACIA